MFSGDETLRIAKLARLSPAPEDLESFTKDFNSILDYVAQLQNVDVSGVEAMSHVHGVTNVFREDEAAPSMPHEAAFTNAPNTHGNFIKVPIIIE